MRHLLCIFFFIPLLSSAGADQESTTIEALDVHYKLLQLPQTTDLDLAVSVSDIKTITEISSSIIKAETWLKTHVLSRYPSTKITTIVVFFPDSSQHKPSFDLVLSSLKNIYHSLIRWGLEKHIKVSSGFSYQCLNNPKIAEMVKPVLIFLKTTNSTFTINPPLNFLSSPDNHLDLLHSLEKFGSLSFNKVNFLNPNLEEESTTTRRNLRSLVNISNKMTISIPTLPSPSPENPPIHSSIGYSSPPTQPYLPEAPISQPPQHPPEQSPISYPPEFQQLPNQGISLPPCLPPHSAPSPSPKKKNGVEGLWCVAKPSVPAAILQQSLDYSCGKGGANCDEIKPQGTCYYPDTVMAHASYAFNSYWQKTKRNGGSCSFGGTAMLISTDPSYQHCRFTLS